MKYILIACALFIITGCTAVTVRPVSASAEMKHVYIQENPKVIVKDFLDVVKDGFSRHGVSTEMVSPAAKLDGKYVVTYTAPRSWDIMPYLSHAEIRIEKDGSQVAFAEYHLRGKGGYSLMKWDGTKTKIDPVMDELLKGLAP